MGKRYVWRLGLVVAAVTAAGAVTALALAARQSAATPFIIHAEFDSVLVPFDQQPADCRPPFLLVRGTGIGSGTHISYHAVGAAEE
jgi:hypothetical protein